MTHPHKPKLEIGSFSKKSPGKDWMPPKVNLDLPERITNAGSSGTYSGKKDLSYRGMDVRHPSRGVGC
jgi:hypothetical protein